VANGRAIAPVRRVLAGIIGTIAVFVVFFGAGRSSWSTVALGVALLILAIGLVAVNALRGGGRSWVAGSAHVVSASEPPANSTFGRCELQIVVDAPGLPAAAVKIRDPRVPVSKWPDAGSTLPILVAMDDPRHVRVQWDDVLTHAEAAAEEQFQSYEEEVRVEPATPDPDDDNVIVTERVSVVEETVDGGTLDLADDAVRVREEERIVVETRREPEPEPDWERERVIVTETPAGPVVEGRLVERRVVDRGPEAGTAGRAKPPETQAPTAAGPVPAGTAAGPVPAGTAAGPVPAGTAAGPVPAEPVAAETTGAPVGPPDTSGGTAGAGATGAGATGAGATGAGAGATGAGGAGATSAGATGAGGTGGTEGGAGIPAPRRKPSPRRRRDQEASHVAAAAATTTAGSRSPAEAAPDAAGTDRPAGVGQAPTDDDDIAGLITAYPSARPGPTGSIHGVGITVLVTELERSVAFYRDMLGFFEIDGGDGNAVLASGDTRLVLRQIVDVTPVNRRVVHLNLEVGDVEATFQELKDKGVRFTYAPRPVNKGERLELWAAAFRDPDGHGIAITQWRTRPTP
jgi:catechol 2,3-dioxygenase-like lactoylglutathione lyase family enzyme